MKEKIAQFPTTMAGKNYRLGKGGRKDVIETFSNFSKYSQDVQFPEFISHYFRKETSRLPRLDTYKVFVELPRSSVI